MCDVIRKTEFVDGNRQLHVAKPGTDLWAAVGVSMGLFGVITRVSFRLLQMRLVEGSESDHNLAESMLGLDKDGMSAISLATCNFVLKKAHPTEVDYDIIGAILGVWISLKSGFPSTNVKLSLLNFRSCSRTRKPATTMPLRFTAKETPFWLSMSYNQKWCELTLTDGLTTKATKGRSSLICGISCSTFLERVFFGARTFPSLVRCGHTTINLAYLKRLADKILARHPRNTNSTHL